MKTASWVIVEIDTGKAVFESFDKVAVNSINSKKYRIVPILEYLQSLNKQNYYKMKQYEFKDYVRGVEKEVAIQQLADRFAIPNDSMRDILMWFEGELHEYGTKLQSKLLDLQQAYELEQEHNIQLTERIEELEENNDNPCGTDDELSKLIQRKDALEEWLTEYRDQLKKENAFHKNQGIINSIDELLDE